jgi:hypothetical protein
MSSQENTVRILNSLLKQNAKIRKNTDAVYFCPVCKHHKRKLEINLITGKYHCWVCDFSGLNFRTLFKKLNLPTDQLINFYQPSTVKKKLDSLSNLFDIEKNLLSDNKTLPPEYIPLYEKNNSIEYKNVLKYIKKRGLTDEDLLRYEIGYCEKGDFKYRVIIPSFDSDNKLNFYTGRSYYQSSELKYKNCPFSKDIIGFESMIDFNQDITLVEGPFDAISVRYNCIPLFGKTLSELLKTKLLTNDIKSVNILLDNDAAKSALKIADFLIKNNITTKIVNLGAKDPSEVGCYKTQSVIQNTPNMTFDQFFKFKLERKYEDC